MSEAEGEPWAHLGEPSLSGGRSEGVSVLPEAQGKVWSSPGWDQVTCVQLSRDYGPVEGEGCGQDSWEKWV